MHMGEFYLATLKLSCQNICERKIKPSKITKKQRGSAFWTEILKNIPREISHFLYSHGSLPDVMGKPIFLKIHV